MPDDTSSRKSPNDRLLAKVIAAIGMRHASDADRGWFEQEFWKIEQDYLNRLPGLENEARFRDLLREFLAVAEKKRALRAQFEPFKPELERLRHLRLNNTPAPDEDAMFILTLLTDPKLLAKAELAEVSNINNYLAVADDYKKDPVRRLVIEPFLALLRDEGVISEDMVALRELPLSRMVETFLDFVGVPPARRRTNLRVVVQYIRNIEKRPARRPKA